jgi:DeoR family transcriptional regulator, glycerol-3-phosphate regulon repressor
LIALRRSLAADTIGAFKFDLAVIGCSAIDAEGDFLDFDIQKVGVSQAVLRQSRRAYLVADRSKLKRTVPARIALLADIDMLFTDAPLPATLTALCRTWVTEIVVAETASASLLRG